MPTILTHAFVGAALAQLGPRTVPRARLAFSLAVLSVFPDLDVVAFHFDVAYSHWLGHRGLSHSLAFAVLVAACVARFEFRQPALRPSERWLLFGLCTAAMASHGLLDAFTDGGLGVALLLPFDAGRYFSPVRPLVVSPIGLANFAHGPALGVLSSEALYVWLPVLAASALLRRLHASNRTDGSA